MSTKKSESNADKTSEDVHDTPSERKVPEKRMESDEKDAKRQRSNGGVDPCQESQSPMEAVDFEDESTLSGSEYQETFEGGTGDSDENMSIEKSDNDMDETSQDVHEIASGSTNEPETSRKRNRESDDEKDVKRQRSVDEIHDVDPCESQASMKEADLKDETAISGSFDEHGKDVQDDGVPDKMDNKAKLPGKAEDLTAELSGKGNNDPIEPAEDENTSTPSYRNKKSDDQCSLTDTTDHSCDILPISEPVPTNLSKVKKKEQYIEEPSSVKMDHSYNTSMKDSSDKMDHSYNTPMCLMKTGIVPAELLLELSSEEGLNQFLAEQEYLIQFCNAQLQSTMESESSRRSDGRESFPSADTFRNDQPPLPVNEGRLPIIIRIEGSNSSTSTEISEFPGEVSPVSPDDSERKTSAETQREVKPEHGDDNVDETLTQKPAFSSTPGAVGQEKEKVGNCSKYEDYPKYREYPGLAEEPYKVKKDTRFQKKFYKRKPVILPILREEIGESFETTKKCESDDDVQIIDEIPPLNLSDNNNRHSSTDNFKRFSSAQHKKRRRIRMRIQEKNAETISATIPCPSEFNSPSRGELSLFIGDLQPDASASQPAEQTDAAKHLPPADDDTSKQIPTIDKHDESPEQKIDEIPPRDPSTDTVNLPPFVENNKRSRPRVINENINAETITMTLPCPSEFNIPSRGELSSFIGDLQPHASVSQSAEQTDAAEHLPADDDPSKQIPTTDKSPEQKIDEIPPRNPLTDNVNLCPSLENNKRLRPRVINEDKNAETISMTIPCPSEFNIPSRGEWSSFIGDLQPHISASQPAVQNDATEHDDAAEHLPLTDDDASKQIPTTDKSDESPEQKIDESGGKDELVDISEYTEVSEGDLEKRNFLGMESDKNAREKTSSKEKIGEVSSSEIHLGDTRELCQEKQDSLDNNQILHAPKLAKSWCLSPADAGDETATSEGETKSESSGRSGPDSSLGL